MPEVAPPAPTPRALSDITVSAESDLAYLIIRDHFNRVVGAGLGKVHLKTPPGSYVAEVRVPGQQEEHYIAVPPGGPHEEVVPAPKPVSAIAPGYSVEEIASLPEGAEDYARQIEDALETARTTLREEKVTLKGQLLVVVWMHSELGPLHTIPINLDNITLRRAGKDHAPTGKLSTPVEFDSCFISYWTLEPGVYEFEHTVPPVESDRGEGSDLPPRRRRAQSVLIEAGWTTEAHILFTDVGGVRGDSATLFLTPCQSKSSGRVYQGIRTEVALNALYVDGVGVLPDDLARLDSGTIEEPIRAMCVGYARLKQCMSESQVVLFPRYILPWQDKKRAAEARKALEKHGAALRAAGRLGAALVEHFPHSVDARLIAVAAHWELEALERLGSKLGGLPGAAFLRSLFSAEWLRGLAKNRAARLLALNAVWLSVAAASVPLFMAATQTISDDLVRAQVVRSTPEWLSVAVACLIVLPLLAWCWLRVYRSTAKNASAYFSEVPILSVGMDILLRLAAVYEEFAPAEGRVTDVALRLTTDSLWTRWDADTTPEQARASFASALKALDRELLAEAPAPPKEQSERPLVALVREAARHLASSLQLPLSFVGAQIGGMSRGALERLLETSPERMAEHFRKPRPGQSAELLLLLRWLKNPIFWFLAVPIGLYFYDVILVLLAALAVIWTLYAIGKHIGWKYIPATIVGMLFLSGILFQKSIFPDPNSGQGGTTGGIHIGPINSAEHYICFNKLKEIGQGIMMYSQDYDGVLPPAIIVRPNPFKKDARVGAETKKFTFLNQIVQPYIEKDTGKGNEIWICPGNPDAWVNIQPKLSGLARLQSYGGQNSYALNYSVFGGKKPLALAQIDNLEYTVGLVDGSSYFALPRYPCGDYASDPIRSQYWKNLGNSTMELGDKEARKQIESRHEGYLDVLFLDGHVDSIPSKVVANLENILEFRKPWEPSRDACKK